MDCNTSKIAGRSVAVCLVAHVNIQLDSCMSSRPCLCSNRLGCSRKQDDQKDSGKHERSIASAYHVTASPAKISRTSADASVMSWSWHGQSYISGLGGMCRTSIKTLSNMKQGHIDIAHASEQVQQEDEDPRKFQIPACSWLSRRTPAIVGMPTTGETSEG